MRAASAAVQYLPKQPADGADPLSSSVPCLGPFASVLMRDATRVAGQYVPAEVFDAKCHFGIRCAMHISQFFPHEDAETFYFNSAR